MAVKSTMLSLTTLLLLSITTFMLLFGRPDTSFFFGGLSRKCWKTTVAEKLERVNAEIPRDWLLPSKVLEEGRGRREITGSFIESLLDQETLAITSLDNSEILEQTTNGSLTAVRVTRAFCKRAAFAHQLNHNLLEIGFDLALERAQELDDYFAKHKKPLGPLHGLPYTMKDQFHMKGMETTMAYVGWVGTFEGKKGTGKEGRVESELVMELNSLGAIPIGKTTLITSLWGGETNNNFLGYLWNPHNQQLSAGGSSGGEGAIQALRGSAFGFGTDIGGSVSMPAAFNGVCSMKPSWGRLSFKDTANSAPGQAVLPTVVGVMGPDFFTIRKIFEATLSTQPWLRDPDVLPIPWRKELEELPTKLTFGLLLTDGIVSPHPPITRALREVAEIVKSLGHEVVMWEPPSHNASVVIHPQIARGDGSPDVLANIQLSGEPIIPQIKNLFPGGKLRAPIPLPQFENATLYMKDFRKQYQAYWQSTAEFTRTGLPVDVVIAPVSPHAAPIPDKSYYYTYSSIVNVLDLPAAVIPVTLVDSKLDIFDKNYKPFTEKDRLTWQAYDADKFDGTPASVQILGQRWEEEKVVAIARMITEALKKSKM